MEEDKLLGICLIFVLMLLALSFFTTAHLDAGKDINKDGYIIDFGYAPTEPIAGQQTNFAVNFANESNGSPIDIDTVWVRISNSKDVLFSGDMKPKNASLAFTYIFPDKNDYTFDFKFEKQGNVIEEQTFDVDVHRSWSFWFNLENIVLVVIVVLLTLIINRNVHRRKSK